MPDEKLQLMCLKRVLEAMPAGNKIIINRVCAMFSDVVAFEHENKMSAKNLALVLNPSMFRVDGFDLNSLKFSSIIIHYSWFILFSFSSLLVRLVISSLLGIFRFFLFFASDVYRGAGESFTT